MTYSQFPWRRLGTLLVERGLLNAAELEVALVEQRGSGRLLGQVLVANGYVTPAALARALAEQHGVGFKPPASAPEARPTVLPSGGDAGWRPLGRVLVEDGLLSEAQLELVLAEQRQHPTRRLGQILVAGGYVSGVDLAIALAEQQGVVLGRDVDLGEELGPDRRPASREEPTYRVYEAGFAPEYRPAKVLYETPSFLEAADFACEFVQREQPLALEIEKVDGASRETVWTYSEARAATEAPADEKLVTTFGFDPVRWNPRSTTR